MTYAWRDTAVRALGGPEQARVVAVLGAVLAMDGADKGALSVAAPGIKTAFGVNNTDIGLLVSVVSLTAAVCTVPVGLLTDRVRRVHLLAISTTLWVVATGMSALAPSYLWLLVSRAALGAVTATAGPTVSSLTGDFFPAHKRARMLGFILGGEMIGTGLGFAASSLVAELLGWRFSFWWLVVPGALVVWAVTRLPEPARAEQSMLQAQPDPDARTRNGQTSDSEGSGAGDEGSGDGLAGQAAERAGVQPVAHLVLHEDPRKRPRWWAIRYVLRVRTNLVLITASALGYFYFTGLRSFATVFVTEHYGVSTSIAGSLVLVVGAGALVGVFVGGRVADRLLSNGWITARILVPVVGLVGVPLLVAPALHTSALLAALPLFMAGAVLLGAVNPPLDAARLDIIHPYMWGTAEGVRTFLRTLGEAAAPTVFGFVSVAVFGGGGTGLEYTLMVFLVALLASAALGLTALRTYPRDVATVNASAKEISAGSRSASRSSPSD
ncbi:MFS transporter [Streptomyces smyrnaeus]|uniref:MFS transporter n=1 Tax=Streptomyces smyrnaeus TaxID=1387713 RepID=UPI0033FB29ED